MSKTVARELKDVAIRFLFPDIAIPSIAYHKICNFIDSEFKELGTCVMYKLNSEFMKLVTYLGLEHLVEEKEVIVKSSTLLANEDCRYYLKEIYHC